MSQHDDTRYGQRSGSGSNQPKRHERKEQDPDWRPRQGGDQTRDHDDDGSASVSRSDRDEGTREQEVERA